MGVPKPYFHRSRIISRICIAEAEPAEAEQLAVIAFQYP